ncbi:MAG: hypothetical protein AB9869_11445 [Verrucomicrobiia bacterium]
MPTSDTAGWKNFEEAARSWAERDDTAWHTDFDDHCYLIERVVARYCDSEEIVYEIADEAAGQIRDLISAHKPPPFFIDSCKDIIRLCACDALIQREPSPFTVTTTPPKQTPPKHLDLAGYQILYLEGLMAHLLPNGVPTRVIAHSPTEIDQNLAVLFFTTPDGTPPDLPPARPTFSLFIWRHLRDLTQQMLIDEYRAPLTDFDRRWRLLEYLVDDLNKILRFDPMDFIQALGSPPKAVAVLVHQYKSATQQERQNKIYVTVNRPLLDAAYSPFITAFSAPRLAKGMRQDKHHIKYFSRDYLRSLSARCRVLIGMMILDRLSPTWVAKLVLKDQKEARGQLAELLNVNPYTTTRFWFASQHRRVRKLEKDIRNRYDYCTRTDAFRAHCAVET